MPTTVPAGPAVPLAVSDQEWSQAVHRERVLRPLLREKLTQVTIERLQFELELSRAQIFRLLKAFRAAPVTQSLLLKPRGTKAGATRLPPELERLIDAKLRKRYLQREKPTIAGTHKQIVRDCKTERLPSPSLTAIRSRVNAFPEREVMAARESSKAARARLDPVTPGPVADLPLDRVQIDHTLVDVHLLDTVHRLPIGRPWLTLLLDTATRMVLGLYLTLDAPSSGGVAMALSQAVRPKQDWLEHRSITLDWPACGTPRELHLDNAAEFTSVAMRRGCDQYGITLRHRPPGKPHYGGHIERLMGTLMGRLQALPGTAFSNVVARGDYPSEAKAILSLTELERIIALEILGPYHNEVHSTLGEPPIAAWTRGIVQRPPVLPADQAAFHFDFLPCTERTVQRHGIALFGITYFDRALSCLISQKATKHLVRFDPNDLSAIFVLMPNREYLRVPYAQLGHPPVSLWEYKATRKLLRTIGRQSVNETAVFEAIDAQRQTIADAARLTKSARRQQARLQNDAARRPSSIPPKSPRETYDDEVPSVPTVRPEDAWRMEEWP